MKKKIIYELNEVPIKIFNYYADNFPNSSFAFLKDRARLYKTNAADIGHLSPWITWPTMHRGVNNLKHKITDLGQDLTEVNKVFPTVYECLAKNKLKVGVFGCLHSHPLPKNLNNYSFFIPDSFANSTECFPNKLESFQRFNLAMVKKNGRNVSRKIIFKDALAFLIKAKSLGLRLSTLKRLFVQIINEQINNDIVVRRRTFQSEIAFDLYFKLLKDNNPDASFFFTNHLASNMHRYWPTLFPDDYPLGKFNDKWLKKWKSEIPHALKVTDFHLKNLIKFCDLNNYELIIASSMGQAAVKNVKPISKQVLITDIQKLLRYIKISDFDWEKRLSMAPRVVIKPKSKDIIKKLKRLSDISINEKKISYFITSSGDIRLDIDLTDINKLIVKDNNKIISNYDIGVNLVNLQDSSGAYAYHVPEGILVHYQPGKKCKIKTKNIWKKISVLDFAPSLIKSFKGTIPQHMSGNENLFI
jgi:hypothetical protein